MKIALFHNLPIGGAKRTVYEQVKHLRKKHKIDLYSLQSTDESVWNLKPLINNCYVFKFKLDSNLPGFLNRFHKDTKNFYHLRQVHKKMAEKINKSDYDVVLVHADQFTQAPFILRFLKIPSLYFCQEYLRIAYEKQLKFSENVFFIKKVYENITRTIRKSIDKKNAYYASAILANSEFTKKNIDNAFEVKSSVCYLGVDVEVFRKISKKRKNYVLYIGDKNKVGGYELLETAIKLIEKDKGLVIKRLGFSKGRLKVTDDKILAKEYSQAIATICTSHNEPFGLAPIESMACETPVIAVNEGGYKETIVNNKTGFLLPRNPKSFSEKIIYLMKNPKKANSMGKEGREHVIKNFTWLKHSKNIETELENIRRV